jgi:flavin reductase (DIM6/NTAB) family NADH-FMN oxidoreductase RutF
MPVEPDELRSVVGRFATGVTVVTLPTDPPHGITVNAFSSVSLDPPLVLVCLDHDTRAHELLSGEGGADGFCVNVLAADGRDLGEHFAGIEELPDPFEHEDTRREASGAPVFERSLAYLDCRLHDATEAGDHTVYFGRVERAETLRPEADPVTFYDGEWGVLTD